MMGGVTGLVLSFFYRKYGPPSTRSEWPDDEDDDEDSEGITEIDDTEYMGD